MQQRSRSSPKANFQHQSIWTGDNLPIMRGLNSESVDLIYLDPPFNSKTNYAAPIGSKAAGAAFKDTWSLADVDIAWIDLLEAKHPALKRILLGALTPSDKSYLAYMAPRLIEMKRLLKPTGSIYLHCDPTMSHWLKIMMDAILGKASFQNEIIWKRTSSHNRAKKWGPVHDVILYYSSSKQPTWNRILQPLDPAYIKKFYRHTDQHGRYGSDNLTGPGTQTSESGQPWKGIDPSQSDRYWEVPPDRALPPWFSFPEGYAAMSVQQRLDELDAQGLIRWSPKTGKPRFKRYLLPTSGAPISDVVTDIPPLPGTAKERTGYPTQKPIALLDRIIKASTNENDVVFDPFCGCATTLVAAENLGRQWLGIDISPKAAELVVARIEQHQGLWKGINPRTDIPKRTDLGKLPAPSSHKKALYGIQGGYCNGCTTHFEPRQLEVDHITARSQGGHDGLDNLQLLCSHCNRVKGDRGMDYLKTRLQISP